MNKEQEIDVIVGEIIDDKKISLTEQAMRDKIKELEKQVNVLTEHSKFKDTLMDAITEKQLQHFQEKNDVQEKLNAEQKQDEINDEIRREEKEKNKKLLETAKNKTAEAKAESTKNKMLYEDERASFNNLHASYMEYVNHHKAEKKEELEKKSIFQRAKQFMKDKTVGKVNEAVEGYSQRKNTKDLKNELQAKRDNPELVGERPKFGKPGKRIDYSVSPKERLKQINLAIYEKEVEAKKETKRLKEGEKLRKKTARKEAFNQNVRIPIQFSLETYKNIRKEKKEKKLEQKHIKKNERQAKREQFRKNTKKFMETSALKTKSLGVKYQLKSGELRTVVSRAATNVASSVKDSFSDKFNKLVVGPFKDSVGKFKESYNKSYNSMDAYGNKKEKSKENDNEKAM